MATLDFSNESPRSWKQYAWEGFLLALMAAAAVVFWISLHAHDVSG